VKRLVPLLLLIAALVGAYALGLTRLLSWPALAANQAALHAAIRAHPLASTAAYVTCYATAVAISLPGASLLTLAGGLLFGQALGATLAVMAATTGAVLLFLAVRYALAPLLAAQASPMLERVRPGLQRDGFSYLLALRLVPVVPFWAVNLAPALAGMELLPFAAATFVGIIPGALIYAGIGAGLGGVLASGGSADLSAAFPPRVALPLLGLALLALAPPLWRRWKARHA
jgi:uncharacterized membrane protein YdjX (TVP38/TMEM64 family)